MNTGVTGAGRSGYISQSPGVGNDPDVVFAHAVPSADRPTLTPADNSTS